MKAIYALIGVSLLMIVGGILLIVNQPPAPQEAAGGSESARDIGVIPAPTERESEIPKLDTDAKPGTEVWCEQMMNLPNAEWTREDSQTFADNCIYE